MGSTPPTALDRLLRPTGIAVLGASTRHGALSGRFLGGLLRHGYPGFLAPVNPKHETIGDLECFPSIAAAVERHTVDLAVVSLPQAHVEAALEECHAAGVAGAIVFASGYGEVGGSGTAEQARLAEFAATTGMRIVGPNSPGFINVTDGVCVIASGVSYRAAFSAGGIGLIAQSGGVGGLVVERAQDAHAGLSLAVCTGNEADLTAGELLGWFAVDPDTRVGALFLEGVHRPERLTAGFEAMRHAAKPVVVLRVGATEAAARASEAHTGALAMSDDVFEAVLHRHGVIRVHSVDDLIDTAMVFDRVGAAAGNRVGIVTTSGGVGVLATEAAERAGLELPPLSGEAQRILSASVPGFASMQNPADMSGMFVENLEIFTKSLVAFSTAKEFDATVIVLTVHPSDLATELAELLIDHCAAVEHPPVVLWIAGTMSGAAREQLRAAGLVVFEDADRCMRALAARAQAVPRPAPSPLVPELALAAPAESNLLDLEVLELLDEAGLPVVQTVRCHSPEDAAAAFDAIGGPCVVKVSARGVAHRSDIGGVRTRVTTREEAAAAHAEVVAAGRRAGADAPCSMVQPLVSGGVELIVGVRRDAEFGPVLVVGAGGISAEILRDVSRRLLPLHRGEAEEMLGELTIAPLLKSVGGEAPVDVAAVASAVESVAGAAIALGERLEAIEVNPLIVGGHGAVAVDAVAILHPDRPGGTSVPMEHSAGC